MVVKAQASPGPDARIVITGSRIPRPNLSAVSPISVLTIEDVKLQGATNIEDALNKLPQVNPSQGEFVSNGASGTATIDLRGLGAARTLVLINGRRLMPGDIGRLSPDINIVPASLVKRVEVLTGGAAAVYGSDAIAGVANFILDTDLEGFRVDGTTSFFQHDNNDLIDRQLLDQQGIAGPRGNMADGGRQNLDLAYGRKFLNGQGHVTLYAGYRQITELRQSSRDYSACTIGTAPTDLSVLQCGGSPFSFPANFFDNLNNVYQLGPGQTFVPGLNLYNFGAWNFYQRPDKRYTAGGFANLELSGSFKPYVEVMYMKDHSVAQIAPSADFANTQTINCDNPLLSGQQRSLICRPGNFVGENPIFDNQGNLLSVQGAPRPFVDQVTGQVYYRGWLAIARRNVEGGPRQADLRHQNLRIVGGVSGEITPGISYDADYVFGRVTKSYTLFNDLSVTRLFRSIDVVTDPATAQPVCRSVLTGVDPNCVPWDIFKPDSVTPAAVSYLEAPSTISGSYKQQLGTAYVNADLGRWDIISPWASESPVLNAGVDYRRDRLDYEPDELAQSGDLAGNPVVILPVHGSIETKEIFGEVRIPMLQQHLIRSLTFEGGYRRSWYATGTNKFSADTYKLALDLTAARGVRLRASQQRAVRAPNLQELFTAPEADSFDRDPCAGVSPIATVAECALTGVSAARYGHIITAPSFLGYNAVDGGNPQLLAETAITRTVGLVLQPPKMPGLNATLDWWSINLRKAIADIGPQTIVDTCVATGDPLFCSRIHRDPETGSLWLANGYVDNRHANFAAFRLRGLDVEASYVQAFGRFGSVNANFRGSYVYKWTVDFGGVSKPFDCAGLYGDPCHQPQPNWRHAARLSWISPLGTTLSLNWRYVGRMKLAALDPRFNDLSFVSPLERRVPSQSYFDLTVAVDVDRRLELRLGVQNIFDREPPRILANTPGADGPLNGNTYPQWYDPLGRYIFAGVTMNFRGI